jgi:NADPH:quinone reductase-like Zn-dependent oxidoreductase
MSNMKDIKNMKAIVVEQSGAPEVLQIKQVSRPEPAHGWVLVRIRAFGLNRSEMFTRQGHSPSVKFPRILGIEAVGEVENDPSGRYQAGQKVAAVMGEMGRRYDGGYAEYAVLPLERLMPLSTNLAWEVLGAIPEMFLTVWASLTESLEIQAGQTLLVRGGTSSIGLTSIALAKNAGLTVLATTRSEHKRQVLVEAGADYVLIDDTESSLAEKVRAIFPQGVERVQELVGTKTLRDSLRAAAPKGVVCMTGILGNAWAIPDFEPFIHIPSSVKLTTYQSDTLNMPNANAALQEYVTGVEQAKYNIHLDRVFNFEDIVEAHRYMESNLATGKLVVLVD